MIECNPLFGGNGRARDGVKVFARFSTAWYIRATGRITTEEPIGMPAQDYVRFTGMLRCDQTGALYSVAHDIEDSAYTYTEVFPDPAYISEVTSDGLLTDVYPRYNASKTYAKGDIVTYQEAVENRTNYTYISDFDDNTGNTPTVYGWSYYVPFIQKRTAQEIEWKSIEELYPDGE